VKRPAALLVAAILATAGCSDSGYGTLGPAPTASPAVAGPGPVASRTDDLTIEVWFVRAGRLAPTRRIRPRTVATSRLTVTELLAGPSAAEAAAGLTTAVAGGATIEVVGIRDGIETVAVNAAFTAGPGAPARLRRAQVVYSLTQFPTVTKVAFRSGGAAADRPVGRDGYADLLPPIVVTAPASGEPVSNPVSVTGSADVPGATVNVRLLDRTGREITTAFTAAGCGSGCRGDYRVTVSYRLADEQPGTVEVYAISPGDGSRTHVVTVAVTLAASGG
jgi:hypothetical protein